MSKPIQKLQAETAWREAYPGFGAGPEWLRPAREAAFAAFETQGLPTPRTEDWRWSDIHRYLGQPYPPAGPDEEVAGIDALLATNPLAKVDASVMVFVNGRFDAGRSLIMEEEGVDILSLADAPLPPDWAHFEARADAIDQLNLAYATDGALVRVRPGVDAAIPLLIVNVSTGEGVSHATRHLIRVEDGAKFALYEVHLGGGDHVSNIVTRVLLDPGASLSRLQLQLKDKSVIQFANLDADIGEKANLRDLAVLMGARFHRQQDFIDFSGEEATARIDGAYLLRGRQHADTRMVVNHAVPRCISRELFKCVLDDHARGAFQGKVHVAPGAQKTDGQMAAHGLLLGEAAEFDAKPELEIYADDVVCAHGATAGALDENQLFYLRARGVKEKRARGMLIAAFVAETFDDIEDEAAREALTALAQDWLTGEGN